MKNKKMVISEWLFKEPFDNKPREIKNTKPLEQTARDIIKIGDKQPKNEISEEMIDPYYFTDRF